MVLSEHCADCLCSNVMVEGDQKHGTEWMATGLSIPTPPEVYGLMVGVRASWSFPWNWFGNLSPLVSACTPFQRYLKDSGYDTIYLKCTCTKLQGSRFPLSYPLNEWQ